MTAALGPGAAAPPARTTLATVSHVRVVIAVPSWDGATKLERELRVVEARGVGEVSDVPRAAVVRAALGHAVNGRFVPLAVATELGADATIAWQPPRAAPEPNGFLLARERAVRALTERAS